MLNFKRDRSSEKLSDQFGMSEERFETASKLWGKVQDLINSQIEEALTDEGDGIAYDATVSMKIFFEHFNTQELQDVALVQFLMRDLSERAEHSAMNGTKTDIKAMLEELRKKIDGEDNTPQDEGKSDDVDFEELL